MLDNVIRAALYLGTAIVGSRAVIVTRLWRWRVCLGLLTTSLLSLSFIHAYRAAEIGGYAGFTYRIHALAIWGSLNIAVCLAACSAVVLDMFYGNRRDWLHFLAIMAIVLDAFSMTQSFGPIIVRWWADLYMHVIG
jgi:hypothetical protein